MVEKGYLLKQGGVPEQEQLAFLNAHPDPYRRVDGRVRLNIKDGALALSSLAQTPGLAVGVTPDWNAMQPMLS